jgi:hypothetical protein
MTTTKRSALLIFAGLFAAATLQTAGAQNDDHEVTIDVNKIEAINVTGSPSITIDTLSTNVWTSGNGNGEISEITSNAPSPRKITVQVTSTNSPKGLGLRVSGSVINDGTSNSGSNSNSGSFEGTIDLLEVGDDSFEDSGNSDGFDFYTGFQSVYNGAIDLTYEAQANASYNPNNTTNIDVQYTLTSN